MGNEKFVSKEIKCLEEFSQTKSMNNSASKKCKQFVEGRTFAGSSGAGGVLAGGFCWVHSFKGKEEDEFPLAFPARAKIQNWVDRRQGGFISPGDDGMGTEHWEGSEWAESRRAEQPGV